MGRKIAFLYGVCAYVAFLVAFLYMIGFLGNLVVPKSIDSGIDGPIGSAIIINVLLFGLFAAQHSVMARLAFKTWWTRIVPKPVERSTFVLFCSLILLLLFWQWRPMTAVVWELDHPVPRTLLHVLFALGWVLVLYSSFIIDHFDLFGVRQVLLYLRGREYSHGPFVVRSLYRFLRHPLMAGFIIAIWSTPTMTQGHLLFAIIATAYIFVGTTFEERDLVRLLGEDYERYRERTPMILPIPKKKGVESPSAEPGKSTPA